MLIRQISHRLIRPLHISPKRSFAVQPFKLPDIGEGIAEVQVMEWFVKEGDHVNEMDKLCLVESDKASVEITSRYQGVIKSIKVPIHETAKVGSVIVEIDDQQATTGETARDQPSAVSGSQRSRGGDIPVAKPPSDARHGSEFKASPAVRALAKSLGVDLSKVQGTGKDGRIVEEDVHKLRRGGVVPLAPNKGTEGQLEAYGPAEEIKLSQVGLAMVKSMNDSLRVPQLTHSDEIECDKLMEMIKTLKPVVDTHFKVPTLTLTAFFIKAVSLGITEIPIINSRMGVNGESYHLLHNHNVSVAMDSPRGLVVPNIKNVESLSIVEIQKHLLQLQQRAKTGRLSLDDIKGGTVSFSNIGVIGGTYAKPVIFDGQAVIGAVGRVQQVPRYSLTGALVPKKIFNVSWTADHRHVDGASVARFSNVFKDAVENPEKVFALHFR